MRFLAMTLVVAAAPALAESDVFHGWSKDGSWLVYQQATVNERVELFFCIADPAVPPTWPEALNEMDREDGVLSCVRFIDPNKAPYQWQSKLVLPAPASEQGGVSVSSELATDGETPGFVLLAGDKKQACYASGTREDSRLQQTWFHPSGRLVAALIDGNFRHCVSTLKAAKAPPPKKPGKRK